jgi:hypothetical protein
VSLLGNKARLQPQKVYAAKRYSSKYSASFAVIICLSNVVTLRAANLSNQYPVETCQAHYREPCC